MIYNIGTDIILVARIKKILEHKKEAFISRILTVEEQEIAKKKKVNLANYIAKRFAAKEALAKALGHGIGKISFQDIAVLNYNSGMPYYKLSERLKKIAEEIIGTDRYNLFLSLSDDKDYASAFTIIEINT